MMLTNKYESYQRNNNAIVVGSLETATAATTANSPFSVFGCSESIHSGQFMVSHFEAEEAAQDDLDDSEVKMLDPEMAKVDEPNTCMEVQLYVPRKAMQLQTDGVSAAGLVTSHLEIETSLTKLFKCMNLAYSQKLTSPKWNHFKGVRLRWKDKIRLNNVIWRCWHMQFILKRRTPVCQFASPLDVDVHSNPQSVVLEGKYWKRQLAVIKAEYRKWRRNSKLKAIGSFTYDTRSEFDFLEWSPLNDRTLMLDDWTSDILFSSINGPFPFPDPREIARGAGIADFIQPSLGPLQPNLEDIDITVADLLKGSRLPPVPEEAAEDMLKNVDFTNFSAIMGNEQMDDANNIIMDVTAVNTVTNVQLPTNDDATMMDLNTPINTMEYSDIEQQFTTARDAVATTATRAENQHLLTDNDMIAEVTTTAATTAATINNNNRGIQSSKLFPMLERQNSLEFPGKSIIKGGRIAKNSQRPFRREPHNYDKAQPTMHQTSIYQQMLAEQQKSQHQHLQATSSYQQQQQQQQQLQYPQTATQFVGNNQNFATYAANPNANSLLAGTSTVNSNNLLNANYVPNVAITQSTNQSQSVKIEPTAYEMLSMFNNAATAAADVYAVSTNSYKPYPTMQNFKKSASTGAFINLKNTMQSQVYLQQQQEQQQQQQQQQQQNTPMHAQSLPLTLTTHQFTPQPQPQTQQLSNSSSQQQQLQFQQQQQQQQQQVIQAQLQQQQQQQLHQHTPNMLPKEMFRSNSLPLNVSLQKLDVARLLSQDSNNFAVPKYHAKSNKSRVRSNSMHQHLATSQINATTATANTNAGNNLPLQAASSDPMLNSTLAQLLTSTTRVPSLLKQHSSSTNAISAAPTISLNMQAATGAATVAANTVISANNNLFMLPTPTSLATGNSNTSSAMAQEMLQRQQHVVEPPHKSPKKSTSLPAPTTSMLMHSPPGTKMLSYPLTAGLQSSCSNNLSLSPESFHDQDSPLSPSHSIKYPRDNQRRAGHIHAEQKRRYNIKNGFDMLHSLIPQLQQNPNAKLSKAAMLQKGAEHIRHLRAERELLKEKMDAFRKERDALKNSLTHLHSILPANGAPVTRQGTEHVRQLYEQYVRYRTMNDWKFWILGLILEPLLSSYTASVSSASMEEMRRTAFLWVDQHCSLVDLRPAVSNKLTYLSLKTDILSDPPSTLQEEVGKAMHNTMGQHPNLHGNYDVKM